MMTNKNAAGVAERVNLALGMRGAAPTEIVARRSRRRSRVPTVRRLAVEFLDHIHQRIVRFHLIGRRDFAAHGTHDLLLHMVHEVLHAPEAEGVAARQDFRSMLCRIVRLKAHTTLHDVDADPSGNPILLGGGDKTINRYNYSYSMPLVEGILVQILS